MVRSLVTWLLLTVPVVSPAASFYVNGHTGNDSNPGTRAQPLRTIREAATRVNFDAKPGADTIVLSAGVHLLTETVLLNNSKFTHEQRLVIRAEVMPDEGAWSPQRMPIVVTVVPTKISASGDADARGLQVESSHVTIEGLRFTGSPDFYYIDGKQNRRSYPIWRDGATLDDLVITQCLFIGNVDVMPLRVAVIANGNGLVLDHCVFFNCENPVVYGADESGASRGNAMRYCLVYGANYSGVWTTQGMAEDFEFHHNIIADSRAAWINENKRAHYKVHDCIFTGNTNLAATGRGTPTPADFMQTENVLTTGKIEIEKDKGSNNYLQLKAGSFGTLLKTGLFKN